MALLAVVAAVLMARRAHAPERAGQQATFAGSAKCAVCHATEYQAWRTSQHSIAMQDATAGSVLGHFDGTRVAVHGVTSTFFQRANRYVANTEGADGQLHDFEIRYTFGVWPLQQYLVAFPDGRVQPLPFAWDARPVAQGGQRWFPLDTSTRSAPPDEFHWTGREQNWNYMCADCHSTAVRKGYDPETDHFRTMWSEIDVACEQCHGPGSRHVSWADSPRWIRRIVWPDDGIRNRLTERRGVRWSIEPASGLPYRSTSRHTDHEIETCAQCHSRRVHIADGYTAGAPLLDFYDPLLLAGNLYFPDGQQLDEVYTYGSFLQSRMYSAGVTCADCHDPHTQALRRPGNQVCTQCHRAAKYDTVAHHFHAPTGAGSSCVSCHMPATTYMQIDPRHDHSMRIPRPDLSVALGVPNACNRCHGDRDAAWAAARVRAWYGRTTEGFQRFTNTFAADDRGDSTSADALIAVANDGSEPAIVRASALARLSRHPAGAIKTLPGAWTHDPSPLVRRAVAGLLEQLPQEQRVAAGAPFLTDSVRAVRQKAVWALAPVRSSLATEAQRRAFSIAAREFVASQRYNADRADFRLTLGTFYVQLGQLDSAAAEYRAAVRFAPHDGAGYVNLAAVLRAQGRAPEAEKVLRDGLAILPDDAEVLLALARFYRDAGDTAKARRYVGSLLRTYPNDVQGQALLRSLSVRRR